MTPVADDARLADDERRAEEIYDRLIRPALRPEDDGKYVAVAVEADDFEIDADDYAATGRLLGRRPGARVWLMRTGPTAAYRLRTLTGGRSRLTWGRGHRSGRLYSWVIGRTLQCGIATSSG